MNDATPNSAMNEAAPDRKRIEKLGDIELNVTDLGMAGTFIANAVIEKLTAQVAELEAELGAIKHAAHMPDDYAYGLPSWINQVLYAEHIGLKIPAQLLSDIESGRLTFPDAPAWKELDKIKAQIGDAFVATEEDGSQWVELAHYHRAIAERNAWEQKAIEKSAEREKYADGWLNERKRAEKAEHERDGWRLQAEDQSDDVQKNWLSPIEANGLRQRVDKLQIELNGAYAMLGGSNARAERAEQDADIAKEIAARYAAERDELREALREYGEHHGNCPRKTNWRLRLWIG